MVIVEVVYALEDKQILLPVELSKPQTVAQVIELSGIVDKCPQIDRMNMKVGIWGEKVNLDHIVQEEDRLEIYRPLTIDPMEARRIRAEKKK